MERSTSFHRRGQPSRLSLAVAFLLAAPASAVAQVPNATSSSASTTATYDLVLLGGSIYNGVGSEWTVADIAITDGTIVAIGSLAGESARRTIELHGLAVVPGFIDIHSHADRGLGSDDPLRRAAPNLVSQGVTTVVVNQDGRSPWPIADQRARYEQLGIGPNAILMVGHGEVRRQIMGTDFQRAATPDEVQRMRRLVARAMREGAWGISAGLEYAPGRWSTTEEVTALVEEIAPDGVYISHERSEGSDPMWFWPSQDQPGAPTLLDAVRETIAIGESSGAKVVASHIKAKGMHYWGTSSEAIQLIREARARGVRIWADQYPYNTTGSDGNTVLIPRWALADSSGGDATNYVANLRHRLADAETERSIRRDIAHEIARRGGADEVVVFDYPDSAYIGSSVGQLAERRGVTPVEMAIVLQLEGYPDRMGGARLRGFSLSEIDIEQYAPNPWVATASDAGIALPDDPPVHARFYGTFPRKIRRYAMEKGILEVDEAIRSSTSLPADIMGMEHRGVIREGYAADIAVIDLERVRDRATFFEPHQYAEGVVYVLVNGELVVDDGHITGKLPGEVLIRHN